MEKITWREVFDSLKIVGIVGGTNKMDVNNFVKNFTTYEYFCFNSVVYKVHSGYCDDTGYRLNFETGNFEKK